MKSLALIALIMSSGVFANAQSSCQQEAQIIAKVARVEKQSMTSCRLFISQIIDYRESIVCPLDITDVTTEGIEIGMKNGHDCEYDDQTVSGILIKNQAGVILFD